MKIALLVFQLIVSLLLITVILLQAKGSGLSGVFGGEGGFYRSKRGVEKMLVYFTIILTVLFFALSISQVLIAK
jgi:preprotein translocase subunit SecG